MALGGSECRRRFPAFPVILPAHSKSALQAAVTASRSGPDDSSDELELELEDDDDEDGDEGVRRSLHLGVDGSFRLPVLSEAGFRALSLAGLPEAVPPHPELVEAPAPPRGVSEVDDLGAGALCCRSLALRSGDFLSRWRRSGDF